MAVSRPRSRRLPVFMMSRRGLSVLPFCIPLFAVCACSAQELRDLTGLPAGGLILSVTPNVATGCGTAIAGPVIQQDAEAQLRASGITVSKLHNAGLAADVDCVPVATAGRTTGTAVHQCLSLSQIVALPGQDRGVTLATTWRKCQSYPCAGRNCEAAIRSGQRNLVDAFLADLRERAAQPTRPQPGAANMSRVPGGAPASAFASALDVALSPAVLIYLLYIMTCLAVLGRWQHRRHQLH